MPSVALDPFDPADPEDRAALIAFLTGSAWPFHVTEHPTADQAASRIDDGDFSAPEHAAFWVRDCDASGAVVGLAVIDDLEDPGVLLDLRLATDHRGRGLGTAALRALASEVLTRWPHVDRLEGQTRDDNVAMRRALRAAGFAKEAHYRRGWPVAGGEPRASVAYTLLRIDHVAGTTTPVPWDDEP
jgi:RimJ/RimL family protein N-acetyltransferase